MFLQKLRWAFIFVLLICFLSNVFAYTVVDQTTIISPFDNYGTYKIQDILTITDVNSTVLTFDVVPVYDLLVNINNKRCSNISYTTSVLTINLEELPNKEITIEIISLTDHYTTKTESHWRFNYVSRYKEIIDNFSITLPRNTHIKDSSLEITNIKINNNSFLITSKDVSSFYIDYNINKNINLRRTSFALLYVLIVILLIVFIYYMFKQKTKQKNSTEKNLLLGLNENEQKIVKLLINENQGLTQNQISTKLFLPKGTTSRNIKKLVSKGYLEIKKYGVSNKVFLGEIFNKK